MNAAPMRTLGPTAVWGVLCLATIITTWVLSKGAFNADIATLLTFAIVAWKIRLVFRRFMELDEVNIAQRLIFETWTVAAPLGIGVALAMLS